MLKWANWAVLAVLALALMFTRWLVEGLGMENTLQSVLIVILPLVLAAIGLEVLSRYLAK